MFYPVLQALDRHPDLYFPVCNLKSFKSVGCSTICKEPKGKHLKGRDASVVSPRILQELSQASYNLALSGVSTGCPEFVDLVYYTKGLTLTVPCASHHPLLPTRQLSHEVVYTYRHTIFCLGLFSTLSASFLLDVALSQKPMPRGKCLTKFRNLSTSLQAGPAQGVRSL